MVCLVGCLVSLGIPQSLIESGALLLHGFNSSVKLWVLSLLMDTSEELAPVLKVCDLTV